MWRQARHLSFSALAFFSLAFSIAGCGSRPFPGLDLQADSPELARELAELDQLSTPADVDPLLFADLKQEMRNVLHSLDLAKFTSAPPTNNGSAPTLVLDSGTGTLSWDYSITGDYDQNGEVNVSDITPLGVHFGKSGDFNFASIESVVDGDSNGEINVSDITPIGVNFKAQVTGFNIYASQLYLDVPQENGGLNGGGAQLVEFLPLSAASGMPNAERLHFEYSLGNIAPDTYYWVRPTDGNSDGTPSAPTVPEGDELGIAGGAISLDGIVFFAPPNALIDSVQLTHSLVPPPAGTPEGFAPVGDAHDIGVSDPELLDAPLVLRLPYDDAGIPDEQYMLALHYSAGEGYAPLSILAVDTAGNTITVDSRDFSVFVVGYVTEATLDELPVSDNVGFDADFDGWEIANFGSNFSPGGNCLGMAAYCVWFFQHSLEGLWGKYSTAGGAPISIAHLTAARAHLAQSQYWAQYDLAYDRHLGGVATGMLMRYMLYTFRQPLILTMQRYQAGVVAGAHAVVAWGYDQTGFRFYDVNSPGVEQHVSWSKINGFGVYKTYTSFAFAGLPSCGRTADFAALTSEAESGFSSSSDISLTRPATGEKIVTPVIYLTGELSGTLSPLAEVVCYKNGTQFVVPVVVAEFDSQIPVDNGENTLIVCAGVDILKQSKWYKNGATLIRKVTAEMSPADLAVTLTWPRGTYDLDLYVAEPLNNGDPYPWGGCGYDFCYFANASTDNGLTLQMTSDDGSGAEYALLSSARSDTVMPGPYLIEVHCRAQGPNRPVFGSVHVLVHQGREDEATFYIPFVVYETWDAGGNIWPPATGADWTRVAEVALVEPAK